ncbi:MAG: hypothetical protein ACQERF_06750 [Actinomycetota bacterium]
MSKPPELPWLRWSAGDRVVLRFRETDGSLSEALGYVTEVAADHVTLDTRRGRIRVDARAMVTGKRVPEPPPRRA